MLLADGVLKIDVFLALVTLMNAAGNNANNGNSGNSGNNGNEINCLNICISEKN